MALVPLDRLTDGEAFKALIRAAADLNAAGKARPKKG